MSSTPRRRHRWSGHHSGVTGVGATWLSRLVEPVRREPACDRPHWEIPFGQPSGPPASARQVQTLLALLIDAGHTDFRDARGSMGFTQRQAAGKFTVDEASAFISQLEDEQSKPPDDRNPTHALVPAPAPERARPPGRAAAAPDALAGLTSEAMARELRRRGWQVTAP